MNLFFLYNACTPGDWIAHKSDRGRTAKHSMLIRLVLTRTCFTCPLTHPSFTIAWQPCCFLSRNEINISANNDLIDNNHGHGRDSPLSLVLVVVVVVTLSSRPAAVRTHLHNLLPHKLTAYSVVTRLQTITYVLPVCLTKKATSRSQEDFDWTLTLVSNLQSFIGW